MSNKEVLQYCEYMYQLWRSKKDIRLSANLRPGQLIHLIVVIMELGRDGQNSVKNSWIRIVIRIRICTNIKWLFC